MKMVNGDVLKVIKSSPFLKASLDNVKEMHKHTLRMFELAWDALENCDNKKAEHVIGMDDKVDELEVEVRKDVLKYLAGMPTGGNVPLSLVLVDSSTHLERAADHIWFIADSALKYPCLDDDEISNLLREEKDFAYEMLKNVENAFGKCDEEVAYDVLGMHERLKERYKEVIDVVDRSDLKMHRAIGVILVARNLLRIGKKSATIMELALKPYPEVGS